MAGDHRRHTRVLGVSELAARQRPEATAQSYSGSTGVTGGPIKYSQYSSGGYDADVRCF